MKKKSNVLSFIAVYMVAFMGVVALCCGCCSCSKGSFFATSEEKQSQMEQVVDSIVNMHVQEIINPVFSSVDEALVYKSLDADTHKYDEVFSNMDDQTLQKVCEVLLNRHDVCSKKSIVTEFLAHPDVYPFLDNETPPDTLKTDKKGGFKLELSKEGSTTVTEAPQSRVEDSKHSKISIKDTVINGKKATVTTRIDYE